jgi:phage tail-like protein
LTQFPVNPHRKDPYKQFKFRVRWDGRHVAGISKITGLIRKTDVVIHREGGDPNTSHKSPGLTSFEPITLERGITHDTEFEDWVTKVWNLGAAFGNEMSLKDFRKDIMIELYNEAGQLVIAYKVFRCWPSEYVALPELDGNNACVAIESITLENEGWERDLEVTEPVET